MLELVKYFTAPGNYLGTFAQRLRLSDRNVVYFSGFFDARWYLKTYPDVAQSRMSALSHFIKFGASEGRSPGPEFDTAWYLFQYPDVVWGGINPLLHYLRFGQREARRPHPNFDPAKSQYRKVGAAYVSSQGRLDHAWVNGFSESAKLEQQSFLRPAKLKPCRLAVGIVTYNNTEIQIQKLVASTNIALANLSFGETAHIRVMIENGDGKPFLQARKSKFDVVPSEGNVGFGAAHNILMRRAFDAGVDYYIMANPDGAFHPRAILHLVEMAQANSNTSVIEALQFPTEHPKIYDPIDFTTSWASGACMLIPKEIYRAIGGFDDNFFMYCEDVDFSWRARHRGFGVRMCPRSLFFHDVDDRLFDAVTHRRFLRSGIYLARKWSNPGFETKLRRQAKSMKIQIGNVATPEMTWDSRVPDFDHEFSFAMTRW